MTESVAFYLGEPIGGLILMVFIWLLWPRKERNPGSPSRHEEPITNIQEEITMTVPLLEPNFYALSEENQTRLKTEVDDVMNRSVSLDRVEDLYQTIATIYLRHVRAAKKNAARRAKRQGK